MDMSQALWDKRCVVEQRIFFWGGHVVCGVLVATPPSMELQSLNHWTATEVPGGRASFSEEVRDRRLCCSRSFWISPSPLRHPLSLFPCQQLSWLAPFAFRADSWLGQVPLFLLPRWHLSQLTLLWLLLWAHASFVFPTHLVAEPALFALPGGTRHFRI